MSSNFTSSGPSKVCKLHQSLYGLRQAPWQWFAKLSFKLCEYGFVHSYVDYSLFVHQKEEVFVAVLVYVADIILAGNIIRKHIKISKPVYTHALVLKTLVHWNIFLRIEEAQGPQEMFLCQCKYALNIIRESGLSRAKLAKFPIEEKHKLALASGRLLKGAPQYHMLVGRLIYLTITWLDLVYAVHILSQLMQVLKEEHMDAAIEYYAI